MVIRRYIEKISNKSVKLPFDLEDGEYEVLCTKDDTGEFSVKICKREIREKTESDEDICILSKRKLKNKKELRLPEEFLDHIGGGTVWIYVMGDKVNIYGEPVSFSEEPSEEDEAFLAEMMKKYGIEVE